MITKAKADYVASAKKEHCCDCSMYREPHKCTLVEGHIAEHGHCRYWEAKNKLPVEK